jgi:two-component system LytT family response regulator
MKALIIDNEEPVRNALKTLLGSLCPQVTEIREANGVTNGIAAIREAEPDVVFLDVEMDDGTGFDLIKHLTTVPFELIFITAHNKYAVEAFRLSAIDFLLKPFSASEIVRSVERATKQIKSKDILRQLQILQESLGTIKSVDKKIVLRDSESFHFVNVSDIIRCEADGAYTRFHITGMKEILISKGLKEYEDMLTAYNFIRVHHSHLINLRQVVRFDKADGGALIMANKDNVPVSQRKREVLLEALNQI